MKWIDIHSHILPGVDDGAVDDREALKMLKIAEEEGIGHVIATPHFHYRRGHASVEDIRLGVAHLQRRAQAEGLQIKLYTGNELYYTHDLVEIVRSKEALTLADSDYILLEFSPETEKLKIQNAIYQFLSEGYCPIIAHMERNQAFIKDQNFVDDISKMGTYFQINADSIVGNRDRSIRRFVKKMIKCGKIQFVATDAHDAKLRPPYLNDAAEWIRKKTDQAIMQECLYENAQKILENKLI